MENFTVINTNDLKHIIENAMSEKLKEFAYSMRVYFEGGSNEELLDRQGAMEFLKISSSTLSRLTKDRKILAQSIGGRVLYKRKDLINSLTQL